MTRPFDHEKLSVYQKSIEFVAWASELTNDLPKSDPLRNQLDRSFISIPPNLAEGNGKHTESDRCRFFDIARGSALESAAALDVAAARRLVPSNRVEDGKELLREIVTMLVGLIRSNSSDRVHEEKLDYGVAVEGRSGD